MSQRHAFAHIAGAFAVAISFLILSCSSRESGGQGVKATPPPPKEGVVVLSATKGNKVSGVIKLTQKDGYVHLTGNVKNLKPGKHGFHIHEFGDLSAADGTSAGGHFNPDGHPHGGPDDSKRHAGDLGNIVADDKGVAQVDKKATGLKLHFVIGRALVVHGGADDLKSQPSGDAGPRVALGVIGIAQSEKSKKK